MEDPCFRLYRSSPPNSNVRDPLDPIVRYPIPAIFRQRNRPNRRIKRSVEEKRKQKRTVGLKDAKNLVSSHSAGLSDTMRVTQDNTDLRGGQTLLGESADLLHGLVGGGTSPGRSSALPGQRTSRDSLSVAVDTTHTVFYRYSSKIRHVSAYVRQIIQFSYRNYSPIFTSLCSYKAS